VRLLPLLLAACATAPVAPPVLPVRPAPATPVPVVAVAPVHDPDHRRGALPSAEARRAELGAVRQSLAAMYAHRLEKESRWGLDEDALFREAEAQLVAATAWAGYDAAIYALLARFHDGHLSYHPPSTAAPAKGYASYRLGLSTVLGSNDALLVATVDAGSDLAAAGVVPGDEITVIDGDPVPDLLAHAVASRAWSRPEAARNDWAITWTAVLYPKGDPPRRRRLTVATRSGGKLTVAITPQLAPKRGDRVTVVKDGDVAIVAIRSLEPAKGRLEAIDAALATARTAKAIVLDLRGDRGGVDTIGNRIVADLGESKLTLGRFRVLMAPETIARRPRWKHLVAAADGYSQPEDIVVDGLPAGQGFTGPIAVLVDASCASTCETVVGALRADLHAVLVGATTAGSSGAPVEVKLPASGATIAIPTWSLVTPDGHEIESVGVVPDVPMVAPPAGLATGDPVLRAALDDVRARLHP